MGLIYIYSFFKVNEALQAEEFDRASELRCLLFLFVRSEACEHWCVICSSDDKMKLTMTLIDDKIASIPGISEDVAFLTSKREDFAQKLEQRSVVGNK